MGLPQDIPFCLTPVSGSGSSPALSPFQAAAPAPARLCSSVAAIAAVVHAVVAKRVQQGDELRLQAARASHNGAFDAAGAALAAPLPRASVAGAERAYFCAQFGAALSPRADCPFSCAALPDITVAAYVSRLFTFAATVSNAVYLLTVLLLDRAMLARPDLFLHSANAHRLVLAAFVVAAKSHEDRYVPNADLARIGGVDVAELNTLEAAFLEALDWRTLVAQERFAEFETVVMEEALDSPQGLAVFQALRTHNVAGLDGAVRRTRSWSMLDVPLSPMSDAADPTWLPADWRKQQGAQLRRLRGAEAARGMVGGVAAAIAAFNFPDIPLFPSTTVERLQHRAYVAALPHEARKRFYMCQVLAGPVNVSITLVPSIFPAPVYVPLMQPALQPPLPPIVGGCEFGSAAKASVHFLLNDIDPFEDLPRAPSLELPSHCATMAAMERECGLEGLLQ